MKEIENKQQEGKFKPNHINIHIKFKWFKKQLKGQDGQIIYSK